MRKPTRMLTIADLCFTLFCFVTVLVWYMHIPFRIEISCVLGLLGVGLLFFSKKGLDSENEFLNFHSTLLESEKYFRSGFDYAASGLALVSMHGRFIKVNHALCQLLGLSEEELLNTPVRKLMHREDFRKCLKNMGALLNGESKMYQSTLRFYNKNQETVKVLLLCSFAADKDNKPLYFVAQLQNVNSLMGEEQNDFMHDSLTKAYSRLYFDAHVNKLVLAAKTDKKMFAILLLDVDALRNVNKSIGHEAGDFVLKEIAERLKSFVRSEDVIARLGGDEFAIVIRNVNDVEIVANITNKILSGLLKAINFNGREIYITASIGAGLFPSDGQDVDTLIKSADAALLKSKQKGGNNYQFTIPNVAEMAQEKLRQQSALTQAIAKDELQLYYQPCVNISDGTISCIEALVRWQSSEYGLVMPEKFIPMAEESGLIYPLSEWVLRTACKQVRKWQEEKGYASLKLAINLSAYQFQNSHFMRNIMRALKESDFLPENLILEVTEGLIMHDHENTNSVLAKIKEEGISVVVDNFGVGFSSFSYLTQYGVEKIKIDRSFVKEMLNGNKQLALVAAMVSMAEKLGIKAVAKGVETKEQYDLLVKENCHEVQGYYIAKPMPIELMESFLATRANELSKTK